MPVTLSIENVPDDVAQRLREIAAANHRSLQGQLLDIVTQATQEPRRLSPRDVWENARKLGIPSDRSVDIIRFLRDTRYGDLGD